MFLSLEFLGYKQVSFMARDLANDGRFYDGDLEQDRSRVNRAVVRANKKLGVPPSNLISYLFNQFTWEGTTGWEYWTRCDYDKVLTHAVVTAGALGLPLHIHKSFDDELLDAAEAAGIELDFVVAERVANSVARNFEIFNDRIEAEYIRLTNVTLPAGTPEVVIF
jgi:hypothetical protein